jgi:hypothetical protein
MSQYFSPEVQAFLSIVIQGIIPILGATLITIAGLALNQVVIWLKANIAQAQLKQLKTIVDFLVMAAQQSGLTGALEADGSAKKQWVIDEVVNALNNAGLTKLAEDVNLIENLIESAVYELKNIKTPPLIDAAELVTLNPEAPAVG